MPVASCNSMASLVAMPGPMEKFSVVLLFVVVVLSASDCAEEECQNAETNMCR